MVEEIQLLQELLLLVQEVGHMAAAVELDRAA
jgi:hypothetical protein